MATNDVSRKILIIGGQRVPASGSTTFAEVTLPDRGTITVGNGGNRCWNRNKDKGADLVVHTYIHEPAYAVLGALLAAQDGAVARDASPPPLSFYYNDLDTGTVVQAANCVITKAAVPTAAKESPEVTFELSLESVTSAQGAGVSRVPV